MRNPLERILHMLSGGSFYKTVREGEGESLVYLSQSFPKFVNADLQ